MLIKWIFALALSCFSLVGFADDFYLSGDIDTERQAKIEQMIGQVQKNFPRFLEEIFDAPGDIIVGNADGKVTLVEFLDFQCPYCLKMSPVINKLIQTNPNLRVVFKQFPFKGPLSDIAAKMALAANLQNKYYSFHLAVMKLPRPLSKSSLFKAAQSAGLDIEQLKTDMDNLALAAQLNDQVGLAHKIGLKGTPSFFISQTKNPTAKSTTVLFGIQELGYLQKLTNR